MRGESSRVTMLLPRPLHPAGFGAMTHCPACGSKDLDVVVDEDVTNFLCEGCGRCWHLEMGYVHRVDPTTRSACPRREECLRRWRAEHRSRA